MQFKKIVGFGDSWMWGDELLDPSLPPDQHPVVAENTAYREYNCFLGQIAQHYALPAQNFGIPGGSLNSTIWTYVWWLQNETLPIDQCLVLIALPFSDRWSFYDPQREIQANDQPWNRYVHGAWINSDSKSYNEQWTRTVKNLYALSDCPELNQLNFTHTVLFFQGQGALHGNNLVQFKTQEKLVMPDKVGKVSSMLYPDVSLNQLLLQQPNHVALFAPKKHPNENGHQLIAQNLINYVDSYIIRQ